MNMTLFFRCREYYKKDITASRTKLTAIKKQNVFAFENLTVLFSKVQKHLSVAKFKILFHNFAQNIPSILLYAQIYSYNLSWLITEKLPICTRNAIRLSNFFGLFRCYGRHQSTNKH